MNIFARMTIWMKRFQRVISRGEWRCAWQTGGDATVPVCYNSESGMTYIDTAMWNVLLTFSVTD